MIGSCKMYANLFLFNVITILVVESVCGGETAPGEVAKTKCKEYSQYVKTPSKCNIRLLPENEIAPEGNVPHMAAFGYQDAEDDIAYCVGALISDDFVLAPAHCLISNVGKTIDVVKLGVTNLSSTEHSQIFKVKKVVQHPEFKPSAKYNDIGLIQLEKKIEANDYVRPACLHTQEQIEEQPLMKSGWGPTEFAGEYEPYLQKFSVNLFDPIKCNETFKRDIIRSKKLEKGITSETMLCVVPNGTLYRHSISSILQIADKDNACMYEIIGVGSFGKGIFTNSVPGVHTRVSAYLSWIEKVVWGED